MTPLNPWDFVFGLITTFNIYNAILAIKFLLYIENLFIGKQDSAVFIFLETFKQPFTPFITFFFFESCV